MTTTSTTLTRRVYGSLNGRDLVQFTLENANGMVVRILNYGGAVTDILVPDKEGKLGNVTLGFETPAEYQNPENPHFGSITGRFANRIAKGQFTLDGKDHQLSVNNNGNTLHGGTSGFNRKIWEEKLLPGGRLQLSYTSPDGEEGFPGNCSVEVIFSLTADNGLRMDYTASCDQPTPFNITNHSYFNLSAAPQTILDHEIFIDADNFIPVDGQYIPVGTISPVAGTAMDLRKPVAVGKGIGQVPGGGYDHTYVLNKRSGGEVPLAASVYHPATGRVLEVFTTEPGVQFYSGNMLTGKVKGNNGAIYGSHAGLCLEAQHFPDSPNQPDFPDTILRPGQTYTQTTIYKFSVK